MCLCFCLSLHPYDPGCTSGLITDETDFIKRAKRVRQSRENKSVCDGFVSELKLKNSCSFLLNSDQEGKEEFTNNILSFSPESL